MCEFNPVEEIDEDIEELIDSEGIPRILAYVHFHYRKDFFEFIFELMDGEKDFDKIRDLVGAKKSHKITRFLRG